MAKELQPVKIQNLGIYGLVRPAEVDDELIPEGALTESVNISFDRKGALTVRPGLTALGSTVLTARPAVGLHNAQGGTALAVFSNGSSSTIYSLSGSTWNMSLDGGTASVKIRFVDFGSFTITPNFMYNTLSSMRFWNAGSSRHWHFTGNPINPQNMWGYNPQFAEAYKSRVYLSGDPAYPSRLFFSSVISSSGNITWSPTTDYVDINPGDGEDNTGLKRYSLELLFFKPNYIYRFRTSGTDPDPLIKIGTRSHESIVEGKRGVYFHHESGFYRYTGGMPEVISRPISDIVDAIPFSQFDDVAGWNDNDHIYWSIGNITVTESGLPTTYKNVVVRYTESSEVWTMYSYSTEPRRGMVYNSGSALSQIIGTDNGVVATVNSGTTDLGEPIKYRARTKWYTLGSIADRKVLKEIIAVCEKAQASEIKYQIDEEKEIRTIGSLTKMVTLFKSLSIRCHRIRFYFTGVTRLETPIFKGLEIIDGLNEGVVNI